MGSLNSLTKNELLDLAKKHKISVQATMKKSELINVLEHHIDTCSFKPHNHKEKAHAKQIKQSLSKSISQAPKPHIQIHDSKRKITIPTKNITIREYEELTVLPQSSTTSLIVWNADSHLDEEMKAWQIKTNIGLDILLPNYARSLFLNTELIANSTLQIFRIYNNDQRVLFREYRVSNSSYQDLSQLSREELDKLMISSFKKKWSSDNNL